MKVTNEGNHVSSSSLHKFLMKQISVEKGESSYSKNFGLFFSLWSLCFFLQYMYKLYSGFCPCVCFKEKNIKQPKIWVIALEMWVLVNIDIRETPFILEYLWVIEYF